MKIQLFKYKNNAKEKKCRKRFYSIMLITIFICINITGCAKKEEPEVNKEIIMLAKVFEITIKNIKKEQ